MPAMATTYPLPGSAPGLLATLAGGFRFSWPTVLLLLAVNTGIAGLLSIEDARPFWHPFISAQTFGLTIAYVVNALSPDHRDYLARGGYGFIIGDGALSYALEQITEAYYSARLFPSFSLTLDDQVVINPAYNRDRGPVVNVLSLRAHVEL